MSEDPLVGLKAGVIVAKMSAAVLAAKQLYNFLQENTGDHEDFPIKILASNDEDARKLTDKLDRLGKALEELQISGNTKTTSDGP